MINALATYHSFQETKILLSYSSKKSSIHAYSCVYRAFSIIFIDDGFLQMKVHQNHCQMSLDHLIVHILVEQAVE